MDLQAAKDLNAGMWLFAKIGVLVCFGLAGILLATSLSRPQTLQSNPDTRPGAHMSQFPRLLLPG